MAKQPEDEGETTEKNVCPLSNEPVTTAPSPGHTGSFWWRQHLVGFLANLASVSGGISMGWSAQALPVLLGEQEGSPLRLTLEQSSWMTALMPLGSLLGALPSGALAQRLGRKWTLLAMAASAILGWLLVLFTGMQVWLLFAGRLIMGFGVGANTLLVSMYCEEIAEVRVRGMIGSYLDLMVCVGMLWAYVLGAVLPYFWYTASSLIIPLVFLFTFCWMPESPAYLVARGRHDEARKSLAWLRGPNADIQPEMDALMEILKKPDVSQTQKSFLGCFTLPQVDRVTVKTVAVILGIMFFTQANGVNGFIYYTTYIFQEAGSNVSPQMSTIYVGILHVVGAFIPAIMVDRLGRRVMLAFAGVTTGLCLLALSVYTHLRDKEFDLTLWRWVPLAAAVLYMFMISAGPGPLSWFMMAELMPMSAKGWGSALAVAFSRLCVIVVVKEFPVMIKGLGEDVTYAIFSVMCFLGIGYFYLCVPESKGKTREEIRMAFSGKKVQTVRDNEV